MLSVNAFAMEHKKKNESDQTVGSLGDLLKITPDGPVRYQFIKHEMGQGISTALAMIIAEELCADWEKVKIDFPDTDLKKFQNDKNGGHDTGGSCTIIYQWDTLRSAGAAARQMLIEAAATYALRSSGAEPIAPITPTPRRPPLVSMTMRPPATPSPSELPPIEASLVLAVGSLKDLYRDFAREAESATLAS